MVEVLTVSIIRAINVDQYLQNATSWKTDIFILAADETSNLPRSTTPLQLKLMWALR